MSKLEQHYATIQEIVRILSRRKGLDDALHDELFDDGLFDEEDLEEELLAELGACMLSSLTNIQEENLSQNSAAYLQSWLNCMKEDKRFIFRVAPQAELAVKYILGDEYKA